MAESSNTRQGRYVRVGDMNVYYEEQGGGEPLVLIGWGLALWAAYMPAFAEHFRVITPDTRGLGKTDNPRGEMSYRLLADDAAAFIEALGLHRPLVCGYSDGGQIALELGMRYPDLAGALVIGAAWWKFSDAYVAWWRQLGIAGPGAVDLGRFERAEPGLVRAFRQIASPDPDHWETVVRQLSVMWATPLGYTARDFAQVTAPTLILVGDRDELVPVEEAVGMYRLIPNAKLAVVAGSTHMDVISNRDRFTRLVLDFLLPHKQ